MSVLSALVGAAATASSAIKSAKGKVNTGRLANRFKKAKKASLKSDRGSTPPRQANPGFPTPGYGGGGFDEKKARKHLKKEAKQQARNEKKQNKVKGDGSGKNLRRLRNKARRRG